MPAGTTYTDLAACRDYLGFQGTQGTSTDGILNDCIEAATNAISAYTRRVFLGTAGTYYANRYEQDLIRNQALYLEQDLYSLTALQNGDGQTVPVGSVWLEPRNAGPPYRVIRMKSPYVWVWNTDSDVIISGTFGYSVTVPSDIRNAATQLAVYLYRLRDAGPGGVTGFQEGGEVTYPPGMPDTIKVMLAPYRSRSGGVV